MNVLIGSGLRMAWCVAREVRDWSTLSTAGLRDSTSSDNVCGEDHTENSPLSLLIVISRT